MHKKHKAHVFFTYSEDLYIRQNYGSTAKAKILIALPTRCWESIQARAGKLQISRANEAMLLDRTLWNSPRLAILRDARLVYLGQISYGLYLYHIPVYESLDGLCPRYGLTNGIHIDALKLALTLALASASWRWFEKPILSLKDRFSYDSIENRLPS